MQNSFSNSKLALIYPAMAWLALTSLFPGSLAGQDTRQKLDQEIAEWRQILKDAQETSIRYFASDREESVALKEKYSDLINQGNQKVEILVPLAMASLSESKNPDATLIEFITRIQNKYFSEGAYDKSYALGERLLAIDNDNRVAKLINGRISVLTNRFEAANQFLKEHAELTEVFSTTEQNLYVDLPELTKKHERELVIREAEKGHDLPQVELRTTKGTIVLELFENQAPDTVGNFISLIESGFYAETCFHRVIQQFMAQGGGFTVTNKGKKIAKHPGYFIYDEFHPTENREHFRGVISMANTGELNTGNSQFFITTVPTPHLDGKHTVFGRVISGMDVVDALNVNYKSETDEDPAVEIPGTIQDKILSTRVIRKRDHEYKPNKFN